MEDQPITLHFAADPGEGFGWGVCTSNLLREFSRLVEVTAMPADVVFVPVADHHLNPHRPDRGRRLTVGYTFFEYELEAQAVANAAQYDLLFCGSTWCQRQLQRHGIDAQVLIQGVDPTLFRPAPRIPDGKFRLFSGGKFEWRKGQDLVIAAFKQFAAAHPEAHLVCAWHNLWIDQIASMSKSPHIVRNVRGKGLVDFFTNLLIANGVSPEQFTVLPMVPQAQMAEVVAQTDAGIFPNRCEGGTNLVLMEYLACGRRAAANRLTGHADLDVPGLVMIEATEDENRWAHQEVGSVLTAMEELWERRNEPVPVETVPHWSWADTARQAVEAIQDTLRRELHGETCRERN